MKQYLRILFACNLLVLLSSCGPRWSETDKGDYNIVDNKGGKTLGYSSHSGVTLLEKNGYAFKDLNKNGEIDNKYTKANMNIKAIVILTELKYTLVELNSFFD